MKDVTHNGQTDWVEPALQIAAFEPGCPKCGLAGPHDLTTRAAKVDDGVYLLDVGWRCRGCGHEWGYRILRPQPEETQEE